MSCPAVSGCWPPGRSPNTSPPCWCGETSHLDPDTRRGVDAQLVAERMRSAGAARPRPATARRLAHAGGPRGQCCAGPGPQEGPPGVAAAAAGHHGRVERVPAGRTRGGLLGRVEEPCDAVKAAGDPRTRSQIAADTLVERLTGQTSADDVDVEVQIMVPVDEPARPRTAATGRDGRVRADPGRAGRPDHQPHRRPALVAATVHRPQPATTTAASSSAVTRRARRFTGWLATLIRLRDQIL